MMLRFMAIIANRESADKSRRVRRKMEQVAARAVPTEAAAALLDTPRTRSPLSRRRQ